MAAKNSTWELFGFRWENLAIIPTDCTGQTVIVTGANTGIGLETAKHFTRLGAARVIMAARSAAKGEAARAEVQAATPQRKGVVEVWPLDLASNASVRAFAARVDAELDRVDVVVENAGVAMAEWSEAEGAETTVQVNVLGTFLLAVLLLPVLKRSAKRYGITPHLSIVSSGVHRLAKFAEGEEEDIFAALARPSEENMKDRYQTSKLMELYAVRELAARLPAERSGVVVNASCPGLCTTELSRNMSWLFALQLWWLRARVGRTAEMGSRTQLHSATAGPASHGKYCSDCEIKEQYVAPKVKTEEGARLQKRVWEQLVRKLESVEPGCVSKALESS